MAFEKILVPTDFSETAGEALEAAIQFGKAYGSSLHLVHAYYFEIPPAYIQTDASFMNPQDVLDPMRASAAESIAALVEKVRKAGLDADSTVILGHSSEVVLAEAERLSADLIVMGTRGLTGLDHVLLGSTAERVVRRAHCPVLTVSAKA